MKKVSIKLAAVLAVALAFSSAKADYSYLYWMVGDSVSSLINGSSIDYSYAKVWYGAYDNAANEKISTGSYLYRYDGATPVNDFVVANDATEATYWGLANSTAFPGGADDYFVYELYDADWQELGFLARQYGMDSYALTDSSAYSSGTSAYVLTGIIPEPSSALLSLVGLGILALRRKKTA